MESKYIQIKEIPEKSMTFYVKTLEESYELQAALFRKGHDWPGHNWTTVMYLEVYDCHINITLPSRRRSLSWNQVSFDNKIAKEFSEYFEFKNEFRGHNLKQAYGI